MASMITISVPEPLASVYEHASETDRAKAQWLIEVVLNDLFHSQTGSLIDTVREISERAAERGMTPEILDEILNDDE